MPERIPQSVAKTWVFRAFFTDGVSLATGKTIGIQMSKNAAAFANPSAGATSAIEIAGGFYYYPSSTTDCGTLGPLVMRGTNSAILDVADVFEVVNPVSGVNLLQVNGSTFSGSRTPSDLLAINGNTFAGANAPADLQTWLNVAPLALTPQNLVNTGVSAYYDTLSSAFLSPPPRFGQLSIDGTGGVNAFQYWDSVANTYQQFPGNLYQVPINSSGLVTNVASAAGLAATSGGATIASRAQSSTAVLNTTWADSKASFLDASTSTRAPTTSLTAGVITLDSSYDPAKSAASATALASLVTTVGAAGAGLTSIPNSVGVTTLLARIGAFTGTGVNTVFGFFKALLKKDATDASDIGGTYTAAADSLEAIRERGDAAWTTGSGGGGGTGTRLVTITVNDGSTALQNASVRIYLNASDNQQGNTDASGVIAFSSAADGTYHVMISLAGYTFTPTTLVVNANTTHTYSMTVQAITPSAVGQTTGYLYYYNKDGTPKVGGVVTMRAKANSSGTTGVAADITARTATSDSNGLVQFTGMLASTKYEYYCGVNTDRREVEIGASPAGTTLLPSIVG